MKHLILEDTQKVSGGNTDNDALSPANLLRQANTTAIQAVSSDNIVRTTLNAINFTTSELPHTPAPLATPPVVSIEIAE